MQGLSSEQNLAMEARHRNMEQIHQRIQSRLQEMGQEFAQASPSGKRVAEQARAVEREMQQFQKQHRSMKSEMGVNP